MISPEEGNGRRSSRLKKKKRKKKRTPAIYRSSIEGRGEGERLCAHLCECTQKKKGRREKNTRCSGFFCGGAKGKGEGRKTSFLIRKKKKRKKSQSQKSPFFFFEGGRKKPTAARWPLSRVPKKEKKRLRSSIYAEGKEEGENRQLLTILHSPLKKVKKKKRRVGTNPV